MARQYAEGETTRYIMTGSNQGREHTFNYTAHAEGIVKRDANGRFIEEFRWTELSFGGQKIPLDESSLNFRQHLSLDPNVDMTPPDITGINPMLIGPVFDLMTFYVDLHPSLHQGRLKQVGDRTHVAHGQPNSWADGTNVIIGQDCIDFDLTLQRMDEGVAVLNVRHVPPAETSIELPAKWMHERVNPESPNNWVQVQRAAADKSNSGAQVVAAAGHETFDVVLEIERPSGRIIKATMDNPVDVVQRHCDQSLNECGEPVKYRIRRQIELKRAP
ncbi:MAG: hypothetical protein L0Y44_16385 [Phycisphaerales bacterium]|nr:hypothetical protein [Phycisphaerales bacterium]